MVRLGDYIEEKTFRVGDDNNIKISGITIGKGFIPTVADMNGVDTSKYKLVPYDYFACNLMHIGRDVKIPLAYNDSEVKIAVSPAYYTFHIKDDKKEVCLSDYLQMLLVREEFGRLTWFHTDGSIRGNLPEKAFLDIQIPLPPISVQRRLVAVYNGLKNLAEQNEALIAPLSNACQAFVVDCKEKYNAVRLGEYIEECNERNKNNIYGVSELQGVTAESKFDTSKANTNELDFTNYKIVYKGEFAYNPSRINLGSIALRNGETCIISPMYVVFKLKTEEILPEFLNLWFARKEFQRSTLFFAYGSVRDTFSYDLMSNVQIPLPPITVQRSIVNLYRCMEEAKAIAAAAREQMKKVCPALVQLAMVQEH